MCAAEECEHGIRLTHMNAPRYRVRSCEGHCVQCSRAPGLAGYPSRPPTQCLLAKRNEQCEPHGAEEAVAVPEDHVHLSYKKRANQKRRSWEAKNGHVHRTRASKRKSGATEPFLRRHGTKPHLDFQIQTKRGESHFGAHEISASLLDCDRIFFHMHEMKSGQPFGPLQCK